MATKKESTIKFLKMMAKDRANLVITDAQAKQAYKDLTKCWGVNPNSDAFFDAAKEYFTV